MKICSNCNRKMETGFFCTSCGAPLVEDTETVTEYTPPFITAPEQEPDLQSPVSYTETDYREPTVYTTFHENSFQGSNTVQQRRIYSTFPEEQAQYYEPSYEQNYSNNYPGANETVEEGIDTTTNYFVEEPPIIPKKKSKTKVKVFICLAVVLLTTALGTLFGFLVATEQIPWFKRDVRTQSAPSELTRPEKINITVIEE